MSFQKDKDSTESKNIGYCSFNPEFDPVMLQLISNLHQKSYLLLGLKRNVCCLDLFLPEVESRTNIHAYAIMQLDYIVLLD